MDDQFNQLDTDIWSHEIQMNGFGFVLPLPLILILD